MRTSSLALALLVSAVAVPALADEPAPAAEAKEAPGPNDAEADALFEEGRKLLAAGQLAEACKKLEGSFDLRPGIGVLFNLGDCQEQLGRTGSAYKTFRKVEAMTRDAGQAEREKVAKERAEKLEARLVKLTISVPPGAKLSSLTLDGLVVAAEAYNAPQILDPGPHEVRAESPGDPDGFDATITLEEEGKTVTLAIPGGGGPMMKRKTGLIVAGAIVMGVGVLGAGAGGVYAASGVDSGDDEVRNQGIGFALVSLAVGAGAGIPMFVVGLKKRPVEAPATASALPSVFVGPSSASATWRF